MLTEEATKLTLGQPLEVQIPHQVQTVLEAKGHHWLKGRRLTKYQALLLDSLELTLKIRQNLNPATLTPEVGPENKDILGYCVETTEQAFSSRPDLKNIALDNPDVEWFTDGSSSVGQGRKRAGYAILSLQETTDTKSLPSRTLAQKAELIVLTRALELGKGKRVNLYTNSKYAFLVLHAHAAIWKKRKLLIAKTLLLNMAQRF